MNLTESERRAMIDEMSERLNSFTVEVIVKWRPDPKLVALAQGAPLGGVAAFGLGRVDDDCERLAGRPASK